MVSWTRKLGIRRSVCSRLNEDKAHGLLESRWIKSILQCSSGGIQHEGLLEHCGYSCCSCFIYIYVELICS